MLPQEKPQKLIKCLTETQLQTLLDASIPYRDQAIFTILADTGLRVAELCGLLVSDLWMLDEPLNLLEVRAPIAKNHNPRSIPLTPRCNAVIANLYDYYWVHDTNPTTHYAFYSSRYDQPLTRRTIHRICQRHGRKFLHIQLHPHMLRHTFATRLMRKTNIRIVQQLLGHSSLTATQIYTHPTSSDLQTAINALYEQQY